MNHGENAARKYADETPVNMDAVRDEVRERMLNGTLKPGDAKKDSETSIVAKISRATTEEIGVSAQAQEDAESMMAMEGQREAKLSIDMLHGYVEKYKSADMELKPMMKTEILTVIQPHVEENLNEIVEKYKMSEEEAAILYTEVVGLIGQLEE